jgi:hypothetical protein
MFQIRMKYIIIINVYTVAPVDAPYWVLGTDYTSYSVVWSCTNKKGNLFNSREQRQRLRQPLRQHFSITAFFLFYRNCVDSDPRSISLNRHNQHSASCFSSQRHQPESTIDNKSTKLLTNPHLVLLDFYQHLETLNGLI